MLNIFLYNTSGHSKACLRIEENLLLGLFLRWTDFFFLDFFNDSKLALVIHRREKKSIFRCFTGWTLLCLCSESHFSQIIPDHILITYASSLPACLEQMIILTLSNASLSLCLRIYYPGNRHRHCRAIRF